MQFGPDGYFYIGFGDGGPQNDPRNVAQNLRKLYGEILRIDVSSLPFRNPPDNPFVGRPGLDAIWALGLRNPWRFSFGRETGDLYIGDVGYSSIEELDFQSAGSPGGENYGWSIMEGSRVNKEDAAHPWTPWLNLPTSTRMKSDTRSPAATCIADTPSRS